MPFGQRLDIKLGRLLFTGGPPSNPGLDEMRIESSDTGDQASLVVGRYLSPRLYVSYGVGLVEAFNTLTLRYKITDKWQIKAESGEYQGADIFIPSSVEQHYVILAFCLP